MDFYKQYPSGLRLVAKRTDDFYTVSFGVYVDVGSVKENKQNNGYSHFLEHLHFKGTKRRSSQQISEEMDDIGANLNAYTAKDCTCFYTKSVASDLEKCVDVLSDMYFFSTFEENEVEHEKSVVIEEINMSNDTPEDISQDLIARALYFEEPLGQTILGSRRNIKYSDRHSLLNFKGKHYVAANTVISVAGKFDIDELDKLIEKYFESNFAPQIATTQVIESNNYKSRFLYRFKDYEQCHLELAFGGCSLSSPKRYALSVLSNILGGGMSSRLFLTIREKFGLAYSLYSYPSFYSDSGLLEIYVGLAPSNILKICELLSSELSKLATDGITEKELERSKAQAVNGLIMSVESNMTLMRLYGRCMLKLGEIYNFEKEIESYKSVTLDDVNSMACDILSQKFASSYVGRKNDNYKAISEVSLGLGKK